jgi:hypothetical protein
MAINFLLALATALGSATLILLVLLLVLKAVAPSAFKQMIPISDRADKQQAIGTAIFQTSPKGQSPISEDTAVAALLASPFPALTNCGGQSSRETSAFEQKRQGQDFSKALAGAGQSRAWN